MSVPTTATFNLEIDDIIERAVARAFGDEESGYDLQKANTNLSLLLQEFQTRGQNLWTMELLSIANPVLIADAGIYTLDAKTVDVTTVFTRDISITPNGDDQRVNRIPYATYDLIPNKSDTGRSYQFYLDRQRDAPVMYLYPVINEASKYAIFARRLRRLYDVGTDYTKNLDVPVRWLPTVIAGLAWYTARDNRRVLTKMYGKDWVQDLKGEYEDAFFSASNEDTDSSNTRIELDASGYFRG